MTFEILGKKWKINVLSKKDYKKKNGKGSVAVTHLHKRRIHLSPNGQDRETIIHELLHAYLSELCTHSADLDEDNLEEVVAELMSKFGYQLLAQADELYWRLKDV